MGLFESTGGIKMNSIGAPGLLLIIGPLLAVLTLIIYSVRQRRMPVLGWMNAAFSALFLIFLPPRWSPEMRESLQQESSCLVLHWLAYQR